MKKIYTLLSVAMVCSSMVFAQVPANRTVNTIIADVLVQLPAHTTDEYNTFAKDLVETGEEGIMQMVKMMNPPAVGNNANVEYALSAITHYVRGEGQTKAREITSRAYLKSLDMVSERETKAFIIRQLELVGDDEAVSKLSDYLLDATLGSPAAQALAAINTESSLSALKQGLSDASQDKAKEIIILALAFGENVGAEEAVRPFLTSNNAAVKNATLRTIGAVGTKLSLADLKKEAQAQGYKMSRTEATESYIALLKRVLKQGEAKLVEKEAKALFDAASKAKQLETQEAALAIQMAANPAVVSKLVAVALKDPSKVYRNVALENAAPYVSNALYNDLLKQMPKANADVQTDILNWFAKECQNADKREVVNKLGNDTFIGLLASESPQTKAAAAELLMKTGGHNAIVALAGMIAGSNADDIKIAQNALLSTKGDVATAVAPQIEKANATGKIAALEIIAKRGSKANAGKVYGLLVSDDANVKAAAYKALKDVVVNKDLPQLYTLLESAGSAEVAPMQQAVVSALNGQSQDSRVAVLFNQMKATGSDKEYLYYPILASTGTEKAINFVVDAFHKQTGKNKDAAFEALLKLEGLDVADILYNTAKDPALSAYGEQAVNRYITLVSGDKLTGENRRMLLTKAMEVAKTDKQKQAIINHLSNTNSFLGMLFVGQYLESAQLKERAAQAIIKLSSNNKHFTGEIVEELLAKVMTVVNNPDAEYQRQALKKHMDEMPKEKGFVSIFNGKDLSGWKGLVENPIARAKMKPAVLAKKQVVADEVAKRDWKVENGMLVFDGLAYDNLCTDKKYGDFEMLVDWNLDPSGTEADAGIYLRGTPQVQIWDISRTNVGAEVGSGGLYNNTENVSKPLKVTDNKLGEWNTFHIKMVGDRATVHMNGELVVNNVMLENFWDRALPIFTEEQIELQAHGSKVYFRNIYVKELERVEPFEISDEEKKEGFQVLFDGSNMHQWRGNTVDYSIEDGCISMNPSRSFGGNLYTKEEYANFVFRFEFQLTPGCNNGLGIRTPLEGDAAYVGMELQILDNDAPVYATLEKHQYHGSVYGIYAAKRGALKPVGEWNYQEVIADGDNIKVILNGVVITDCNLKEETKNGTRDGKNHPGVSNASGHIAFLGHGSPVKFKNIRVKRLK